MMIRTDCVSICLNGTKRFIFSAIVGSKPRNIYLLLTLQQPLVSALVSRVLVSRFVTIVADQILAISKISRIGYHLDCFNNLIKNLYQKKLCFQI